MIDFIENKVYLIYVCKKLNVILNNVGKYLSLFIDFDFFFLCKFYFIGD